MAASWRDKLRKAGVAIATVKEGLVDGDSLADLLVDTLNVAGAEKYVRDAATFLHSEGANGVLKLRVTNALRKSD